MENAQNVWLEANRRALAEFYPDFRSVEPSVRPEAIAAWQGTVRPFPDGQDLSRILDDLDDEADVLVSGGTLLHDHKCRRTHRTPDYLSQVRHTKAEYTVLAVAYPPRRHPRAFIKSPHISKLSFPSHPHINADGSACSYLPSQGTLPWNGQTMRALLDFTAIWLAKHLVWQDTGAKLGGRWIGPVAGHTIPELLATVPRNAECPCGSGRKYKHCHRLEHEQSRWALDSWRSNIQNSEVLKKNGLR